MGRVKRGAGLIVAVLALALLAPSATASANPCRSLKPDVVEHTIDYAMERSTRGELAEALDLRVRIEVRRCEPLSRRRATWQFRLIVRDQTDELVREVGSVMVTRRRAVWVVSPSMGPRPPVPSLDPQVP